LLLAFLCGVMIATMLSVRFPARRKTVVMTTVTALLALTALLAGITDRRFPLVLLPIAMGAENGVFNREGEVAIGLTYMTGTLVRIGQRLTGALLGSAPAFGWMRHLLLWLGFVVGVLIGGRVHVAFGDTALWAASAAAGVLTLLVAALTWRDQPDWQARA
jgi:uncharacterized membrane protein YoaK (UPF0700 family)